ncbi:MAG: zinc ribbon domain-containing protein, partial [archaeon]|nr:zinc ribbon domain-containing protein [archaeon]
TLMDEEISFTWDGTSYWDAISEGEYYINLTLNDVAGNIITDSVNITVDEYSPSVYYYSLDTSAMTPREIQNVTVQTDGGIIDDSLFQLYYRFSATDPWTIVVADYNYVDWYHRWNATIPASLTENDVYFYMNATDYAGNYIILDEQYYFEAEVSITINELSEILSKSSWDPLDLTVEINSGEAYIEKLYINYTLDDVDYQVELDNETQTRYVLSTIDLNAYPDSIDYVLYVEYIDGNIEMLYNISLESPPEVTITIDELSEVLSKTAWDPFDLTVEINSGEAYIEKLYVNYTLDAVIYQVDLENETQTRYVLSTIDLDACPESIDYILYVEYIDGNSVLLYTISLDSPSFAFSIGDISAASTYDSFDMIVTSSIGGEYVNSVYVNFTINSVLNQTFFTQETSTRYVLPTIEIGEFISSIHYFVYAELENGTNYAITDISLSQPSFTLTTDDVSVRSNTGNVKRKLDDLITIIISNIQVDYVDNVYLDYKLDDAVEYSTIQMSLINGSSYSATIEGNPQCYKLEYEVRIVDIKAQTHTVQSYTGVDAITQEYIPSFPEVELTFPMNIVAIVISGAIGAVFSVMSISSKRKNMKQIQDRFLITLKAYSENQDLQSIGIGSKKKKFKRKKPKSMKFIETTSPGIHGLSLKDKNKININEKAVDSIGTQVSVPFMADLPQRSVDSINNSAIEKSRVIYRLSNLGTLTSLLVSIFLSNVLDEGAIAMLVAAAGLMFSSFGLMERIMLDVSKSLYTEKKYSYFPAIFHTILIASLMITFMYSGTLVPWFNYYVLQETFTAGTIAVPRLYLSLLMPFFSSVVLIIYTSYKELKREMKKFELMKLTGENWKVIWQQKEEKVSKINSNVNMKMLIFIATIAFALISTTQIGRYAEIGMILLIPFIFIWFTAIVINSFFSSEKKSIEEALNNWIIEKVKICPKCETENLFDNRFCIHCQNSFEGKMQIIEDTIKCHRCKNRSPRNSIYCRSCGIILIKKKKRFTKNKKKNIKKQKKKGEEKRSEKLKEPESLPVSLPEPEPIFESEEIETIDSLPESLPEPEPIIESEEIETVDSLPVSLPEPEPITEFEEMKAVDSLPKTDNIDESKTLKESEDSKESKESKDSEGSES